MRMVGAGIGHALVPELAAEPGPRRRCRVRAARPATSWSAASRSSGTATATARAPPRRSSRSRARSARRSCSPRRLTAAAAGRWLLAWTRPQAIMLGFVVNTPLRRPGPSPDARDRGRARRGAGVGDLGGLRQPLDPPDRRAAGARLGAGRSASSWCCRWPLWEGAPSLPSASAIAWIVVGGVGVSVGLTLSYAAIGRGAVSVVSPGHGDRRRARRARERGARRAHRGRDGRRPRRS